SSQLPQNRPTSPRSAWWMVWLKVSRGCWSSSGNQRSMKRVTPSRSRSIGSPSRLAWLHVQGRSRLRGIGRGSDHLGRVIRRAGDELGLLLVATAILFFLLLDPLLELGQGRPVHSR